MRLSHKCSTNTFDKIYQLLDNVNNIRGLVVVKRILILLMAAMFLVACSNKTATEDKEASAEEQPEEDDSTEYEVTYDKEANVMLADDENISMDLFKVAQLTDDVDDYVMLQVALTNKQNRSYDFYVEELKVDGKEVDSLHLWTDDNEINPNEILVTFINGYEEELTIQEHVAGTIIYKDYEGNRNKLEFNEYINE